jgi:electron transport complex protein RnfA
MNLLAALGIFSGLSLNLMVQFALGIGGFTGKARGNKGALIQGTIMFLSCLILWIFCSLAPLPFMGGLLEYFLLFPLSGLLCLALELPATRLFPDFDPPSRMFSALTGYDGLVFLSLLITMRLALSFLEALILSFFFALGCLCVVIILNEIRRRSGLERVLPCLRGSPLLLISMGILSLVFSSSAVIFFRILKVF